MSSTAGQSGKPLGENVKTATSTSGICRSLIACLASGSRAADSSNRKNGEEAEEFLTEESSTLVHAVVGTCCDPKAFILVDPRTGSVLTDGRIKIRTRR